MKNILTTVLFLCTQIPLLLFGQSQELTTVLNELESQIQTVEAKKYSYGQKLTKDEKYPYQLNFEASRTDKKDKSTSMELFFNLKDIDKQTVKIEKAKDLMVVRAFIKGKNNYIKTFSDGEKGKYQSKLEIIANDIDNAREIEKLLEEAISLAVKIPRAQPLPTSYEEQVSWLLQNIVDAERGTEISKQSITREEGQPSRFLMSRESNAKKGTLEQQWSFNLIDLDDRKMELKVDKKSLYVNVLTKSKNKYIRYQKNGNLDNYSTGFKIYTKDIESGKAIAEVLNLLAIESREKQKALTVKGSMALVDLIKPTAENEKNFEQSIEGDYIKTLKTAYDKKGETVYKNYKVNFADLDPKSVSLDVSKKTIWVKTKTAKKQKYVEVYEGDNLKEFKSDFAIRAGSIENARMLLKAIPAAIQNSEGKNECGSGTNNTMSGVAKQIEQTNESLSSIEQTLEAIEETPGQWKFTRLEKKSKKDKEESWIFSLSDLDAKKITFKVSKKNLVVSLQTNQKESIIKYYKDAEPDGYKNEMKWTVKDVASARALVCALRGVVDEGG